ncbi:hypothetical protein BTVI_85013 [Pitangus sulphuratus]|nr:hypothetical protein BTVI_85013 [Pitangus sulphuratus]
MLGKAESTTDDGEGPMSKNFMNDCLLGVGRHTGAWEVAEEEEVAEATSECYVHNFKMTPSVLLIEKSTDAVSELGHFDQDPNEEELFNNTLYPEKQQCPGLRHQQHGQCVEGVILLLYSGLMRLYLEDYVWIWGHRHKNVDLLEFKLLEATQRLSRFYPSVGSYPGSQLCYCLNLESFYRESAPI